MAAIDDATVWCEKCRHLAVAWARRGAIERQANEEKRPLCAGSRPASPGFLWPTDANFKSQLSEYAFVERMRAREVGNPNVTV
jgi:hypothetical protein